MGKPMKQSMRVYTRHPQTQAPRLFVWRDLELSILDSGKWAKAPAWNLAHAGLKRLKCGRENIEFTNLDSAREYLKTTYNLNLP